VFCCLLLAMAPSSSGPRESLLKDHLMVTMYGNPRSTLMGALGEQAGAARAARLTAQGAAYQAVTSTPVVMAYHLVATVAQCTAGNDGLWRRRETSDVIDALLADARAHGFRLILDVQPGRSTVAAEVQALVRYLKEPDVDLGLDPEFSMTECEVPGREIGQMRASDVNIALDILEREITSGSLPPKVLIVHQFRLDMLPDKANIRASRLVDVVLNMDGFGSQSLKLSSYRTVMKQPLPFAGIKLFYKQDVNLFSPAQVLALTPRPSVVIYQ
jgi:hypothetical protein